MDAVGMIRLCYQHQWPADYGRPFIADPNTSELFDVTPQRFDAWPWSMESFTTWCPTCQCDHGPQALPPVEYGTETA